VEITTESDGDDRISVIVSTVIPPSSDHPLYDQYAYEFEKAMGLLVAKCLSLNEKFKLDNFSISAFTIEATMVLRGKHVTYPDLPTCPCPKCNSAITAEKIAVNLNLLNRRKKNE
jgi:hypothetical protein